MKNKIIQILIAALVIVSVGLSFYLGKYQSEKARANRMTENVVSLQKDINSVNYTLKELKSGIDVGLDSVLKEAKIKPKWVQEVTNITNQYIDTTMVVTNVVQVEDSVYKWKDTEGCIKIEGLVRLTGKAPIVTTTSKKYETESTFIEYVNRPMKPFPSEKFKLWQWRLPIFKKESSFKEITSCGDVKFHKVNVVKKD